MIEASLLPNRVAVASKKKAAVHLEREVLYNIINLRHELKEGNAHTLQIGIELVSNWAKKNKTKVNKNPEIHFGFQAWPCTD